jgi:hypothetical protein
MTTPVSDLRLMISGMEPILNEGIYAFASVPHGLDLTGLLIVASIREAEGISLIVSEQLAQERGMRILYRCAWITLNVHSDLNAFGLTAAFANALAEEKISCNVVAGAFHDHIFVPVELATKAVAALERLQRGAQPSQAIPVYAAAVS